MLMRITGYSQRLFNETRSCALSSINVYQHILNVENPHEELEDYLRNLVS